MNKYHTSCGPSFSDQWMWFSHILSPNICSSTLLPAKMSYLLLVLLSQPGYLCGLLAPSLISFKRTLVQYWFTIFPVPSTRDSPSSLSFTFLLSFCTQSHRFGGYCARSSIYLLVRFPLPLGQLSPSINQFLLYPDRFQIFQLLPLLMYLLLPLSSMWPSMLSLSFSDLCLMHGLSTVSSLVFRFWLSIKIPTVTRELCSLPQCISNMSITVVSHTERGNRHFAGIYSKPMAIHHFHHGIRSSQLACTRYSDLYLYEKCIPAHTDSCWSVQLKHGHNISASLCAVTQGFKCSKVASRILDSFFSVSEATSATTSNHHQGFTGSGIYLSVREKRWSTIIGNSGHDTPDNHKSVLETFD